MKTKLQITNILQLLSLICAFNLSSLTAVESVFGNTSEKIVFTINDGQGDLYTMDPDGSNLTNITDTPSLSEGYPRWCPDGTKISFYCDGDIWIMNKDGSNRTNLTQTPGFHEEHHSWSPDGCQIVYGRLSGNDGRIYVMNSDGTNHIELTSGYKEGNPSWSPDGTKIVFQRDLKPGQAIGLRQLYVMNSDGTDVQRITYTNGEDFDPAWSPDATRILFMSNRSGNIWRNQIYVGDFSIGTDGVPRLLNQTNITNNQWRQGCARWSPDGNRIVYCRAPAGTVDFDLWVSNADGSGLVQLTNTPGISDTYPDWAIIPKPNQMPIAFAGPDETVEQESHEGTEITLDGSGSTDPDSTPGTNDDIVLFEWYEGTTLLGTGETLDYTFSLGAHTVNLVVTDSQGETDDDEVIIVVNTPLVVTYLKDDAGLGLAGKDVTVQPAYGGSWGPQYSGTTDTEGAFEIDEMEEGYTKIRMIFNQASVEQTLAELNASGYTWTAVPLTIQFQDDMGGGLADGKVDQGGSTWVHHGYTNAEGKFIVHVFPEKQYKFRVGYDYTSMTKWFDVPGPGAHTEVFQTVLATVKVLDFEGYGLADVRVDQGGSTWVHHGYTDSYGELNLQLFGDQDYKFRVSGDVVNNSSETVWFTVPGPIEFQTGYVIYDGTAVKASIGGRWIPYTPPGMNILPGTYKFIFSSPTPSPQWITVNAGEITNID